MKTGKNKLITIIFTNYTLVKVKVSFKELLKLMMDEKLAKKLSINALKKMSINGSEKLSKEIHLLLNR